MSIWPDVSGIAEDVKSANLSDETPGPDAEVDVTPVTETTAETPATDAPATAPVVPSAETTIAPAAPSTESIAKLISEKGAAAFIAELPDDVKEKLGPELNKKWYQRLNERDLENKRVEAQRVADREAIQGQITALRDEILTAGMTEEDRRAYQERKELETLRAQRKAETDHPQPTPEQVNAYVAQHPGTRKFWDTMREAGLPADPRDPRVAKIWADTKNAGSLDEAETLWRAMAANHKPQPAATTATPAVDIEKLVAERLEAALDKKLKGMGLLSADTGKPGSGGGPGKANTSWEVARKESEAELRASFR